MELLKEFKNPPRATAFVPQTIFRPTQAPFVLLELPTPIATATFPAVDSGSTLTPLADELEPEPRLTPNCAEAELTPTETLKMLARLELPTATPEAKEKELLPVLMEVASMS